MPKIISIEDQFDWELPGFRLMVETTDGLQTFVVLWQDNEVFMFREISPGRVERDVLERKVILARGTANTQVFLASAAREVVQKYLGVNYL